MKTIEIFCGTKSASKVFAYNGWETFTVDNDPQFVPDLCADVLGIGLSNFPHKPDVIWASPPCQGFSVAVIGRNWNHDATPKTDSARLAMALARKTIEIIKELNPKYWFIENPRGMLRKMLFMQEFINQQGGVRHTVAYCQYGDTRQKPTDIWTNCKEWMPKPMCSPGATCHVAAPRGSRTGTQGLKGAKERGVIPPALFEEIIEAIKLMIPYSAGTKIRVKIGAVIKAKIFKIALPKP